MGLIFKDRFKFVHMPFVIMVKFQPLIQFSVDHLSHPVTPSLVFLLSELATYAYYEINYFISTTTKPTLHYPAFYYFLLRYN